MGDWQELGQAVFIGLVFSFLVAKLISTIISFKEDNLKLSRSQSIDPDQSLAQAGSESEEKGEEIAAQETVHEKNKNVISDDDSDSWEGIESTELDEEFSTASAFVATMAATSVSSRVSNDVQLQLYGLYKIATEGPCTAPQPSALNFTARAKWNAWQRLGAMPTEEAMQKYITVVTELYPSWASGSTVENKNEDKGESSSAVKGTMGPVFSSLVDEEEDDSDIELELDAIHIAAREGKTNDLLKHLNSGTSVNLRDGEGRTPLHWAVDRGHLDVVNLLLNSHADVNAKDSEGQAPLHYAVICEQEAIAELLVKHTADIHLKDNDGNSPPDLGGSNWAFMTS